MHCKYNYYNQNLIVQKVNYKIKIYKYKVWKNKIIKLIYKYKN